jgi:4-hydroxyphenylpyruvate dioxygenase
LLGAEFSKGMNIDHVHFYVEDATAWREWFVYTLGFESLVGHSTLHTQTEVVKNGKIHFVLSSPLADSSPVSQYLSLHPPGVADVAFQVVDLEKAIATAVNHGAQLLQPIQQEQQQGSLKWAKVSGWGDLTHTLVERSGFTSLLPYGDKPVLETAQATEPRLRLNLSSIWLEQQGVAPNSIAPDFLDCTADFIDIDHVVLNVATGDLAAAVVWYENTLGFERQQTFAIQTERSGLCSQVLVHPQGGVKFPINEPASATSQIQEFLDVHRGSGVQHIALQTADVVQQIAHLRQRGLAFLPVPPTYYSQLRQRPGFCLSESALQAIAHQQVLVDWREDTPQAMLLQAFSQPIFELPTFFFELIERQTYSYAKHLAQAQGFGEGNFRALFEAIEREQIKRGSLT